MCGVTHYATAVGSHFEKIRMENYLVHFCSLTPLFRMKTDKCMHILLTPLYYNIVLWHMSALTGSSSGNTTDTFQQQGQKNAMLDVKFNLATSVICYAAVIWLTQLPHNVTHWSLRWILHFYGLNCIRHKEWVNAYRKLDGDTNTEYKPNLSLCAM